MPSSGTELCTWIWSAFVLMSYVWSGVTVTGFTEAASQSREMTASSWTAWLSCPVETRFDRTLWDLGRRGFMRHHAISQKTSPPTVHAPPRTRQTRAIMASPSVHDWPWSMKAVMAAPDTRMTSAGIVIIRLPRGMLYRHIVHALPPTILSLTTSAAFCCCGVFMVCSVIGVELFFDSLSVSGLARLIETANGSFDLQQNIHNYEIESVMVSKTHCVREKRSCFTFNNAVQQNTHVYCHKDR